MTNSLTDATYYAMKKIIRDFILNYPSLNYQLKKMAGRPDFIELALSSYFRVNRTRDLFFIQIGANNGINHDPLNKFINKYKPGGILIEPVPHLFEQLKKNYAHRKGLLFENVAIGNPGQKLTFYRVKSDRNKFYDQLGSFDLNTILRQKKNIPGLENLLVEEPVMVISFDDLVKKHTIKTCDVLMMDTEGYDAEIIKLIDLSKTSFDLVIYESKHLNEDDKGYCLSKFRSQGYKTYATVSDTLCVNKKLDNLIKRLEGRHTPRFASMSNPKPIHLTVTL